MQRRRRRCLAGPTANLAAYRCEFCAGWHVGQNETKRETARQGAVKPGRRRYAGEEEES
jgi:hypothetical protein